MSVTFGAPDMVILANTKTYNIKKRIRIENLKIYKRPMLTKNRYMKAYSCIQYISIFVILNRLEISFFLSITISYYWENILDHQKFENLPK